VPGANQVNLAVFVGTKMKGLTGAVAALLGLCLMPVTIVLTLGFVYFTFKEVPAVKGALHGASAAAVALTLAMVIQTGQKCLKGVMPIAFFLASFVLNGLMRWPLLTTLAILAPLSLIWAWPRKQREPVDA
jgi:chromate transporter